MEAPANKLCPFAPVGLCQFFADGASGGFSGKLPWRVMGKLNTMEKAARGRSVPARQDMEILETADTPEYEIDRTEPAQSAADRTETAQSTADEESPSLTGTDQHNNKQTLITKADLIKKVEVIRSDLIPSTKVLETLDFASDDAAYNVFNVFTGALYHSAGRLARIASYYHFGKRLTWGRGNAFEKGGVLISSGL